jgi:hypothetical protein
MRFDGACEGQAIRSCHRSKAIVIKPPNPGYDRAVLTSDHQLHLQIYSPALASNQTHEIGATFTPAHAVDQGNGAVGCFEAGLEHERAFTITTRDCGILLRCDLPVPVFRTAEQSSKACCGIETRQGKPVDRPVSAYHCSALAIPDKRVILDESRHVCSKFGSLMANS